MEKKGWSERVLDGGTKGTFTNNAQQLAHITDHLFYLV